MARSRRRERAAGGGGVAPPLDGRRVAAEVLLRVWRDAAFASAALDAEVRRHPQLAPREVALATELVYGLLRVQPYLEARLVSHARRGGLGGLTPRARAHLLVGAHELLFLERVPAFAAVSEAVERVTAASGPRVAGFANALLRKLAAEVEASGRPTPIEAFARSVPAWLREALVRALGDEGARDDLSAGPLPPPIGLRLERGEERGVWLDRLRRATPDAELAPGRASPRALLVRGAGDPRRLPGHGEAFVIQEEGSQVVALALGARPGERVLDACAGRGNKTSLLLSEVGPDGALVAADLSPAKLDRLRADLLAAAARRRVSLETRAVDWTVGPADLGTDFDRVLVDAPCSGLGTVRRRPELLGRRHEEELAAFAAREAKILLAAASRARAGGRIVYAVCSLLREEGEEVVARAVAADARLEPAPFDAAPARALAGDASSFRLLPHVHGTDGYFVASFVKR